MEWLIYPFMIIVIDYISDKKGYDRGYKCGHEDGYKKGYDRGYKCGYNKGLD